jgi:hypothetical protein
MGPLRPKTELLLSPGWIVGNPEVIDSDTKPNSEQNFLENGNCGNFPLPGWGTY